MTDKNRVDAGVSTGGQYAPKNNTESDAVLAPVADEKTFTCFGRWAGDELVIDYTVEGEVEDYRPEFVDGFQSFCASGVGATSEAAEQEVRAEYDGFDSDDEHRINNILLQFVSNPERSNPATLDKIIRELDQYINEPETMLDAEGQLRSDLGPRVNLNYATAAEIALAHTVLKRVARLRDHGNAV